MEISELRARLDEAMIRAREDAVESHKCDANCYGAGYDAGYLKALDEVLRTINGEEDGVI